MPGMLEQDFSFRVLGLSKIPNDQTVAWRSKVIFWEGRKSDHINWTSMTRELSHNCWAKLILVGEACISIRGQLPYIKYAYFLIVWTSGNIVLIKLAPVNCINIIKMSLQGLCYRLIRISSYIPEKNVAVYSDGYQFTGRWIIFESKILNVPQMAT